MLLCTNLNRFESVQKPGDSIVGCSYEFSNETRKRELKVGPQLRQQLCDRPELPELHLFVVVGMRRAATRLVLVQVVSRSVLLVLSVVAVNVVDVVVVVLKRLLIDFVAADSGKFHFSEVKLKSGQLRKLLEAGHVVLGVVERRPALLRFDVVVHFVRVRPDPDLSLFLKNRFSLEA